LLLILKKTCEKGFPLKGPFLIFQTQNSVYMDNIARQPQNLLRSWKSERVFYLNAGDLASKRDSSNSSKMANSVLTKLFLINSLFSE
jgi:hypothetical protein